ncbi:MAG: tryptophan 7-halogenase [Xanthomonadales bacterium]|nr:tryptophan 7-halogenase [Xanthomonadales bacterium]
MDSNELRSVVIVGGGPAAWTAASVLSRALSAADVAVVVPDVSHTTPAAEATLPTILGFHQLQGLNEPEVLRQQKGSFRLGTRFQDWNEPGHRYINPIGAHGASIEFVAFHNYAVKARQNGEVRPFNEYSLVAMAGDRGRFSHPVNDPNSVLSTMRYALHLDAAAVARSFRQRAEAAGVTVINGSVASLQRHPDSGFIQTLNLDNGSSISGDLFVDCSGPGAVLMDALEEPWEDWSHWLPANRSLRVISSGKPDPDPLTRIIGKDGGWLRQVESSHQTEHRLVFCDAMLDEESALATLSEATGKVSDVLDQRVQNRMRRQPWSGNCLALGAAAGGFEPLQMDELHLVHTGLMRFVGLLPDRSCHPALASQYNRVTRQECRNIRDFLVAHYRATARDGEFWRQARASELPDSLAHKLDLFAVHGQVAFYEDETFPEPSWVSLWLGQEQWPAGHDLVLDGYDFERLRQRFDQMAELIQQAVAGMPTHGEYLQRFARA